MDVNYKTHLLLGEKPDATIIVVKQWGYPPSQNELQTAINAVSKDHRAFVMVTPVGPVEAGEYAMPVLEYGGY